MAWRARSSVVASTIANGIDGSSEGKSGVLPAIRIVSRWPVTETASSSPTEAPLWTRNSSLTMAGRSDGFVGRAAERKTALPPPPKIGSASPFWKS